MQLFSLRIIRSLDERNGEVPLAIVMPDSNPGLFGSTITDLVDTVWARHFEFEVVTGDIEDDVAQLEGWVPGVWSHTGSGIGSSAWQLVARFEFAEDGSFLVVDQLTGVVVARVVGAKVRRIPLEDRPGPWDEDARCESCGAEQRGGFDRFNGQLLCRACLAHFAWLPGDGGQRPELPSDPKEVTVSKRTTPRQRVIARAEQLGLEVEDWGDCISLWSPSGNRFVSDQQHCISCPFDASDGFPKATAWQDLDRRSAMGLEPCDCGMCRGDEEDEAMGGPADDFVEVDGQQLAAILGEKLEDGLADAMLSAWRDQLTFGSIRTVASGNPDADRHGMVLADAPMVNESCEEFVEDHGPVIAKALAANWGWGLHGSVDEVWNDGSTRGWSPFIEGTLPAESMTSDRSWDDELRGLINDGVIDAKLGIQLLTLHHDRAERPQVWAPDGTILNVHVGVGKPDLRRFEAECGHCGKVVNSMTRTPVWTYEPGSFVTYTESPQYLGRFDICSQCAALLDVTGQLERLASGGLTAKSDPVIPWERLPLGKDGFFIRKTTPAPYGVDHWWMLDRLDDDHQTGRRGLGRQLYDMVVKDHAHVIAVSRFGTVDASGFVQYMDQNRATIILDTNPVNDTMVDEGYRSWSCPLTEVVMGVLAADPGSDTGLPEEGTVSTPKEDTMSELLWTKKGPGVYTTAGYTVERMDDEGTASVWGIWSTPEGEALKWAGFASTLKAAKAKVDRSVNPERPEYLAEQAKQEAESKAFWAAEAEAYSHQPGECFMTVIDAEGTGGSHYVPFPVGTFVNVTLEGTTLTGERHDTLHTGLVMSEGEQRDGTTQQQVQLTKTMTIWAKTSELTAYTGPDLFLCRHAHGWTESCDGCRLVDCPEDRRTAVDPDDPTPDADGVDTLDEDAKNLADALWEMEKQGVDLIAKDEVVHVILGKRRNPVFPSAPYVTWRYGWAGLFSGHYDLDELGGWFSFAERIGAPIAEDELVWHRYGHVYKAEGFKRTGGLAPAAKAYLIMKDDTLGWTVIRNPQSSFISPGDEAMVIAVEHYLTEAKQAAYKDATARIMRAIMGEPENEGPEPEEGTVSTTDPSPAPDAPEKAPVDRLAAFPVDKDKGTTWDGVKAFTVVIGSALDDDPTNYTVFAEDQLDAIEQVDRRRGGIADGTLLSAEVDWDHLYAHVLCPLCGEVFTFKATEDDEPFASWLRCTNPACPGGDYTMWSDSSVSPSYYGGEFDEPRCGVMGRTCECGEPMVMNVSCSCPTCFNPDCPDFDEESIPGLEQLDFDVSGVDPATVGIMFCDECGEAFGDDGDDPAVDLYDEDGFGETRTLCGGCRDNLEHDEAGNALDPREGKTLDELPDGAVVGIVAPTPGVPAEVVELVLALAEWYDEGEAPLRSGAQLLDDDRTLREAVLAARTALANL